MKTADLIPLILHELNDGDKYGFELTKEIEDKSNQQIQIKQPTLYTVLKKLEKSKFITSYWQDSEIGGKRHYYKITDNGKAQLQTLPSFDESLNAILLDDSQNEEENEARYISEEKQIAERISNAISNGGKRYGITFGREVGIVIVQNKKIDHLYIEGRYQDNGFGTRLLGYALSETGKGAYIDVPVSNKCLLHICDQLGLVKTEANEQTVRMMKPEPHHHPA